MRVFGLVNEHQVARKAVSLNTALSFSVSASFRAGIRFDAPRVDAAPASGRDWFDDPLTGKA